MFRWMVRDGSLSTPLSSEFARGGTPPQWRRLGVLLVLSHALLASTADLRAADTAKSINVRSYGAQCDGRHMVADTAAFAAILSGSGASLSIYVPPGHCQIDNSVHALQLKGISGAIYGDGNSSSISFRSLTNDGLEITNPRNFTLSRLQLSFEPTPTNRGGGQLINIQSGYHITLDHLRLHGGSRSGIRVGSSTLVDIKDVFLYGFKANGVYTVNNVNLSAQRISCRDNGDGCFESSYYDSQSHSCDNIRIGDLFSENDVTGILINGCSHVSVNGFTIQNPCTRWHFPEQRSDRGFRI